MELGSSIAVIILTFNEQKHIKRCIDSLIPLTKKIVVVDSFSTDGTASIAHSLGAQVLQHHFINHSKQLNWAIDNANLETEWIMRLDADEYLSRQLINNLQEYLPHAHPKVTGLIVNRKVIFLGKHIHFGGFGSKPILRIWRNGSAICESRWMDEHMVISYGKTKNISGDLIDENLNNISWWTQKHLNYAVKEAIELLNIRYGFIPKTSDKTLPFGSAKVKRIFKENFYSNLPLGLRPILYFAYRMIFLAGVLDGPKGWAFNFFQGLWYRLIVDIKILEVENRMKRDGLSAVEAIIHEFGIHPNELNRTK